MKFSRLFSLIMSIMLIVLAGIPRTARADDPPPPLDIKYGQTVEGKLTDKYYGYLQYYVFDGKVGDTISASVTFTSGTLTPELEIGFVRKLDDGSNLYSKLTSTEGTDKTVEIKDYKIPSSSIMPDEPQFYVRVKYLEASGNVDYKLTLEGPGGESSDGGDTTIAIPTIEATEGASEESVCAGLSEEELNPNEKSKEQKWDEPEQVIDENNQYCAVLDTSKGKIVIELYPKVAPKNVNSFVFLAINGFYDGVPWHRVIPNFVAQTGDPTGTGTGGPGYTVPLEIDPDVKYDREGRVGAARANDPDSAGSQFFITYAPLPSLDPHSDQLPDNEGYTIIGQVVEGMDVAQELHAYEAGSNENGEPDTLNGVYVFEIKPDKEK